MGLSNVGYVRSNFNVQLSWGRAHTCTVLCVAASSGPLHVCCSLLKSLSNGVPGIHTHTHTRRHQEMNGDDPEGDEDEEEVVVMGGDQFTPEEIAEAERRFEETYGRQMPGAAGAAGAAAAGGAGGAKGAGGAEAAQGAAAPVYVLPLYAMLPQVCVCVCGGGGRAGGHLGLGLGVGLDLGFQVGVCGGDPVARCSPGWQARMAVCPVCPVLQS